MKPTRIHFLYKYLFKLLKKKDKLKYQHTCIHQPWHADKNELSLLNVLLGENNTFLYLKFEECRKSHTGKITFLKKMTVV